MKSGGTRKTWDEKTVVDEWLRAVLEDGRKANVVTVQWRKENRGLPEEVYGRWVRNFKQRLHQGSGEGESSNQWPQWLADRLAAAWGARAEGIKVRLSEEAPLFVRTNTLKTTPEALVKRLADEGIPCRQLPHGCLRLEESGRGRIFRSAAYREGWCEVQDAHSQQVAPLLAPAPGETVIDACAGEGGKTLQMSELMNNRGRLRAFDPQPRKLELLRQRARRAGLHNIEAKETPIGPAARRIKASANAVLIDAPCSGTGVIRRHPEIKWRLKEEQLAELTALQSRILAQCAFWAKPGGRILYATCSLLPEEGEQIVASFLDQNASAFEKIKEQRWWPETAGGDAFYAALLKRTS